MSSLVINRLGITSLRAIILYTQRIKGWGVVRRLDFILSPGMGIFTGDDADNEATKG